MLVQIRSSRQTNHAKSLLPCLAALSKLSWCPAREEAVAIFPGKGVRAEGEHEEKVWSSYGSQTPPPLLAGMHTAPVGGERLKKGGGNMQT